MQYWSHSPRAEDRLNAAAGSTTLCSAVKQTGTEQKEAAVLAICSAANVLSELNLKWFSVVEQGLHSTLSASSYCMSIKICNDGSQRLTFSPSVVRTDKALGTSKAVFCFFTLWMQETGITTCKTNTDTEKVRL